MGNMGFLIQEGNEQRRAKGKEKGSEHGIKFQKIRKPDSAVCGMGKPAAYHEHFFFNDQIAGNTADNTAQHNDNESILQELIFK